MSEAISRLERVKDPNMLPVVWRRILHEVFMDARTRKAIENAAEQAGMPLTCRKNK